MSSTERFYEPLAWTPAVRERVLRWLEQAQAILVGMGAGLSAFAGLNYVEPAVFQYHFPAHAALGLNTVWQAVTTFWDVTEKNARAYWGYWARHIRVMRYEPPALLPYQNLARLLQKRDWFIVSTNADGQIHKLGLEEKRLYTPQGDYSLLQCSLPCREEVYDAWPYIKRMLEFMGKDEVLIREEDIPRCPHCERFLVPNLRKDDHFVDALHRAGLPPLSSFS